MRTLSTVKPLENYRLQCTFDDGAHKIADISIYLNTPAFLPLQQQAIFNKVRNHHYFVEWADCEIDLSADTLWHIGVNC